MYTRNVYTCYGKNEKSLILFTLIPLLVLVGGRVVSGFSASTSSSQIQLSTLLDTNKDGIAKLKTLCSKYDSTIDSTYMNDVFYLRYCISYKDDENERIEKFTKMMEWRTNTVEGKSICQAAIDAVKLATSTSSGSEQTNDKWNNQPVITNAPNSIKITKEYITSSSIITTTTSINDLIYCIRAGNINDTGLMSVVSINDMVQFFLYVKEVNSIVANIRSLQYNQLVQIITCNDLSGIKLIGSSTGSTDFRKALSLSSNIANDYYPSSYNGITLLVNLPILLSFLVQLFTPLFPNAVKERLKFSQGPLKDLSTLQQLSNKNSNEYKIFSKQIDTLVYNK